MCVPRLGWLALGAVLLAAPGLAADCDDRLDSAAFDRLTASSGSSADVAWPEGVFPLGHPMDLVIRHAPGQGEAPRYRAYMRYSGAGAATEPEPLDIISVAADGGANRTTVRLDLDLPPEDRPRLMKAATFLVTACSTSDPSELRTFVSFQRSVSTRYVGWLTVAAALALGIGVLALAAGVLRRSEAKDLGLKLFFVDFRNRVSLSLFQVFIFTSAVYLAVAYVFGRTRQLSDLSDSVLLLLGISAAGAVAGKLGDVQKHRLSWENWSFLKFDLNAFPAGPHAPQPRWSHLVTTQGQFDVYRFQALLFTLFVAPAFVLMSLYSLGDATIPTGILSVLGISQVTYVAGKVVLQPTLAQFGERVEEVRAVVQSEETLSDAEWRKFIAEFEAAMETRWNPNSEIKRNLSRPKAVSDGVVDNRSSGNANRGLGTEDTSRQTQ